MMAIDPRVKQHWIHQQMRFSYPVDVYGQALMPDDEATLSTWRAEGIDQYMLRQVPPVNLRRPRGFA
jgi:hypothetical protein